MSKKIEGFSKFTKSEKIDWITKTHFKNAKQAKNIEIMAYFNFFLISFRSKKYNEIVKKQFPITSSNPQNVELRR